METNINRLKTDFSRTCLISNISINLIITRIQGICFKCQKDNEINLISERIPIQETRKYCFHCAISSLSRLEKRENENKQVIQEIIQELKRQEVETYNKKVYQRAGSREETRFYTFPNGKKIARPKCGCNLIGDNGITKIYDWCLDNCQYFTHWRNKFNESEKESP